MEHIEDKYFSLSDKERAKAYKEIRKKCRIINTHFGEAMVINEKVYSNQPERL